MDTGKALDITLKRFKLNASKIGRLSGVDKNEISKFRNRHKDMHSKTLFKIIRALPLHAQMYFLSLCIQDENEQSEDKILTV